jgi:serine/threonine protein kinase
MTFGNFELEDFIGKGTFGKVYAGKHVETGSEVAIKLESFKVMPPTLDSESIVYQVLSGCTGIPKWHEYGMKGKYNFMVIELLGPSLRNVFKSCDKQFGMNTICVIAEQMITCLEQVHGKGIIHRDIKPSNICVGRGVNASQTYLVDFGSVGVWGLHISNSDDTFCGTATWASMRAHLGWKQSRRDDLESLGYTIAYLILGSLPWENQCVHSEDEHEGLASMKRKFLRGSAIPDELMTYLSYCRRLGFSEDPDYYYLRCLFMELCFREGVDFDWTVDWAVPGWVPTDSIGDDIMYYLSDDETVTTPHAIASDHRPPSKEEEIQLLRKASSAPPLGQPWSVAQEVCDFKEECEDFIAGLEQRERSRARNAMMRNFIAGLGRAIM